MTPPAQATPHAAARARRQATAVAAVGAAVPTVLAAQGMASLATDLLGFPVLVAVALASFLELALVSSALLARAAARAGRPGGADAVAVWVVSATSGLLAAMHELVSTSPGGGSTWEADPGVFLAAAVRAVALPGTTLARRQYPSFTGMIENGPQPVSGIALVRRRDDRSPRPVPPGRRPPAPARAPRCARLVCCRTNCRCHPS